MNTINFSSGRRCRACLQQTTNEMYSLLVNNVNFDGIQHSLGEIYGQCTQLSFDQDDPSWHWICQNCYEKLVSFFEFRIMCIESYNKLQESAFDNFKVEPIDIHESITSCIEPEESQIQNDETPQIEGIPKIENTETENTFENMSNDKENDATQDNDCDKLEWITHDGKVESSDSESDYHDSVLENLPSIPVSKVSKVPIKSTRKKSTAKKNKSSTSSEIYKCEECPKKFFVEARYHAHKRKHLGLKLNIQSKHFDTTNGKPVLICGINDCGKSYSVKETLYAHMLLFHIGLRKPPAPKICDECGNSFKTTAGLTKHKFTHSRESTFKCDVCSKMLPTQYELKIHKWKHDGIKNFVCPTCGARKTTGKELGRHMKIHIKSDVKYPCNMCPSIFNRPANRSRHVKVVHCGIRAYSCPHCDQSFGKAETLKHHVMTHTGEKPHACQICDKRFIQPTALKTHMKTHYK